MTISLPPPPARAARSSLPLFAALVPVLGGVGIWLFTGSIYALWFAALGPLIAIAALVDGVLGQRRRSRRDARERAIALDAVEAELDGALERARSRAWAEHPDVARLVRDDAGVWRSDAELVLGVGGRPSGVTVAGSAGDDERALSLLQRAERVSDAPVTAPWRSGICVAGDGVEPVAVLRALLTQLCLRVPPTLVRIVGELPMGWEWVEALPHRRSRAAGAVRVALRVGQPATTEADVVFALAGAVEPVDPRAATVVKIAPDQTRARVGGDAAGERVLTAVEALSLPQAVAVARSLVTRSQTLYEEVAPIVPSEIADVWRAADGGSGGLPAAFALESGRPVIIDLVADGPHAVVVGVTGSGKSELLTSWIAALCAIHPTSTVSFLLADFKGGTAFDSLASLPHVTGVITDLDGHTAVRAISSLRAELRYREGVLAAAGARDVGDDRVALPRLVVVVDEYAALLGDHLELAQVFADVAARGRALGIHLILGTQRATGVIRDAVLGNAPLRIALRVTDTSDSRLVIGTDEAARLPGGAEERGRALVRRAADVEPVSVQILQTSPGSVAEITRNRAGEDLPRLPWLPPLPTQLPLDEARVLYGAGTGITLGVLDDPNHQRRREWNFAPSRDRSLLVLGTGGSGRTHLLRVAAAQESGALWLPSDPEHGWDVLEDLARGRKQCTLLLIDDIDAFLAGLGDEYALLALARLEAILRAGRAGVLASARRVAGPLARIADLFGHRAVLAQPTRAEFAHAGGESSAYVANLPPGRAWVGGLFAQIACVPGEGMSPAHVTQRENWEGTQNWSPGPLTALVTRSAAATSEQLASAGVRVLALGAVPPTVRMLDELAGGRRALVVVGDPESWQQRWSLLTDARDRLAVMVDAACPTELRMITGDRELPPFARSRAARGWLVERGGVPRRIRVPDRKG